LGIVAVEGGRLRKALVAEHEIVTAQRVDVVHGRDRQNRNIAQGFACELERPNARRHAHEVDHVQPRARRQEALNHRIALGHHDDGFFETRELWRNAQQLAARGVEA
jgi:hypothetical protein